MFSGDALLLIGHGSDRVPDAARPLLAHAEAIRATGRFAEVAVGMLRGEPPVATALDRVSAAIVHVVPCFFEDGFFTRVAIPGLLLPNGPSARVLRFCPTLGQHDGIAALMRLRLERHCERFGIDPAAISVLIVGHGSRRDPGRTVLLRRHAAALEALGRFGWIRIAHLDEPPLVPAVLASTRGHAVTVIGYLANQGLHVTKDLPEYVALEQSARGMLWPPVYDLGPIGDDAGMPGLIVDQVLSGL